MCISSMHRYPRSPPCIWFHGNMICPGLNDVQTNREVRLFSVSLSDLHYLDLLVVLALRLEVLRARLEAAEEGAPVRVRAVHEDQLPVRQPLQQLHPHVGLKERDKRYRMLTTKYRCAGQAQPTPNPLAKDQLRSKMGGGSPQTPLFTQGGQFCP